MRITCLVEFSENQNFKKGKIYQIEEFSSLNAATARACYNFEEKKGYDKVYFEFQVNNETFYYCKYYVQANGKDLLEHLKELIPEIVDDSVEQNRLIDLFEMCFNVKEYSQEKIEQYFNRH